MTFGEVTVALDMLGYLVALPVAVWLFFDSRRRRQSLLWVGLWLVAVIAGNALFGVPVLLAYVFRRGPIVPGRRVVPRLGKRQG